MRAKLRGNEKGMTIVELGVTLAVIGIVAALAVPSFINMMPRLNLNSSATTLGNEIALMRARAIAKGQKFHLVFNAATDSFTLRNATTGTNFATGALFGDTDLYQLENLNDSTLSSRSVGSVGTVASGTENYQDFTLGTAGRVYLQTEDGTHRKRVSVESTGRVAVERWNGGPLGLASSWVEE